MVYRKWFEETGKCSLGLAEQITEFIEDRELTKAPLKVDEQELPAVAENHGRCAC